MRIPLGDIFIGPRQRKDYGAAEMDDLVNDLKENGQIQAITVRPPTEEDKADPEYGGQPWCLVAGGRRWRAALLLAWPDLEGYAREEMSMLTARTLELHENLKRKAMNTQEELAAKAEIVRLRREENPEITEREIAKELGQSQANFSKDLKAARLLEEHPELASAGTKSAILNAGKALEEAVARNARAQVARRSIVPPLAERVVTSRAAEFLQQQESNFFDLALLDGPYGYDYWTGGQKNAGEKHLSSYDDSPETTGLMYREMLPELVRTVRETGWLVFFAGKETYDFLEETLRDICAEHASYRHSQWPSQCESSVAGDTTSSCRWLRPNPYPWYWHRPNSRNKPRFKHLHAQNVVELILVCNMGKATLARPGTNIFEHDAEYGTTRLHANQKPLALYKALIERFTYTGDRVVDTFFGSANSLAAGAALSRVVYGCDSNSNLLRLAHANIERNATLITETTIKEAERRAEEAAKRELEAAFEEETEESALRSGPPPTERPAGDAWTFEVLRLEEGFLGYIRYAGHNMVQRRGSDLDALEMQLSQACRILELLSRTGQLDPSSCSPEEADAALRTAEEAA